MPAGAVLRRGVIEATVRALAVAPPSLLVWLGPAIGPRHFEIGPEVRDELLRGDPRADAAFARNARGRYMADFVCARAPPARAPRHRAHLRRRRMHLYAADEYFSHRRDGRTGRQATLIWLDATA